MKEQYEILAVIFDRMKSLIVTGGTDMVVHTWQAGTNEHVCSYEGHVGPILCFALDGHFLFSGSEDTNIHVWRLSRCKTHARLSARVGLKASLGHEM